MNSGFRSLSRALAETALAGDFTVASVADRWTKQLGRRWRWVAPMATRLVGRFGAGKRPRVARVAQFLAEDERLFKAWEDNQGGVSNDAPPPRMRPAMGRPQTWKIPRLLTPRDLAEWLRVPPAQLRWFADLRTLEAKLPDGPLRHYRYRWLEKRTGSVRLIESPKPRLKTIQQQILHAILDRIPPHSAAHGFRAGHSIRTFAAPHVRRAIVLRLDLRDFFPSVPRARIAAIFLTAGYPEPVAELLTGLCTNVAPRELFNAGPNASQLRRLYHRSHLPQGAPTSPALANLAAWRLDRRLAGLAACAGAAYTRYADDLVFSGEADFARIATRFLDHAGGIALEEGFQIHYRKTRVMRPGVAQRAAGLVLNEHVNIPRAVFDEIKAIVHNCRVHGPASQNHSAHRDFRAHLAGRIAQVETIAPERGRKLRAAFEQIAWTR